MLAKTKASEKGAAAPAKLQTFLGNRGPSQSADSPEFDHSLQAAGNLAVQRLLQSHRVQAKLQIGPPDDEFEREADRVAEGVVSKSPTGQGMKGACRECEQTERVQPKRQAATSSAITPIPQPYDMATGGGEIENEIASSRGGGSPLDNQTQSFMEQHLEHDFSKVRIHSDGQAAHLTRQLNAKAFTYGNDIYLGASASASDHWLLAHELTHVVQQSGQARDGQPREPAEGRSERQHRLTQAPERAHESSAISTVDRGQTRGQQTASASLISRAAGQSVQRFLFSKCSSEYWNAIAAWGSIIFAIVATVAALVGLGVITVGSAGSGTPVTAPASIAVLIAGAIGTLAGIAWAISAHEALSKCMDSDPDADEKEKAENRRKLQYLEQKQKEIEQQLKEKQKMLDDLRKNLNEDGTPKKPGVNVNDLPNADDEGGTPKKSTNVHDLPDAK